MRALEWPFMSSRLPGGLGQLRPLVGLLRTLSVKALGQTRSVFFEERLRRVLGISQGHVRSGMAQEPLQPRYGHTCEDTVNAERMAEIVNRDGFHSGVIAGGPKNPPCVFSVRCSSVTRTMR